MDTATLTATTTLPAVREPAIPLGLTLAEYVTGYAEAIQSAANRLARSFLLPDALRLQPQDPPEAQAAKVRDVGVLLARALSTREDLLALAQSIYLVGGRPALASAYLVARAQQVGAIKGAPRYRTEGVWPDIAVTASCRTPDGEEHEATVSMQEAREDGWAGKNPKYRAHRPAENMLCHRAAARLIRRVAPGVVLGMAVAEEVEDEVERGALTPAAPAVPNGRAALGLRQAAPVPAARTVVDAVAVATEAESLPTAAADEPDEVDAGGARRPRGWRNRLHALGWGDADAARMAPETMRRVLDERLTPTTHRVNAERDVEPLAVEAQDAEEGWPS